MIKTFVLDTNVLLHSAESLDSFEDNNLVIPMTVLEELDKFKRNQDELGRNCRHVIRRIDELRGKGSLYEGVSLAQAAGTHATGTLRVVTGQGKFVEGLDLSVPDNRILRCAWMLQQQEKENVILVTKDINMRLKADGLGIPVQDFEKERVRYDELYTGLAELVISADQIEQFYREKEMPLPAAGTYWPNQFILLQDEANPKRSALAWVKENRIVSLPREESDKVWSITPRSREQRMALSLLMDPSIKIVTLVGQAGSGKTFLALAAALENVLQRGNYDKILVSRPVIPMGNDIGYMPGGKDDKLDVWMQPIYDNFDSLLRSDRKDAQSVRKQIDMLKTTHKLELEALTYIRGRSIPRQFMIVDEAQNLTPHEVKTILSRAADGTKIVLTGDPSQIDSAYLDSSSNGLSYAVEHLKVSELHGHITLRKSERSDLSRIAAELL